MNDLEEFNYINNLYEIYGSLLTENQILIMDQYYKFNLSLSEIADENKISRSAVLDSLKHSKEKLLYYEEKLNFFKKRELVSKKLNKNNLNSELIKEILEDL